MQHCFTVIILRYPCIHLFTSYLNYTTPYNYFLPVLIIFILLCYFFQCNLLILLILYNYNKLYPENFLLYLVIYVHLTTKVYIMYKPFWGYFTRYNRYRYIIDFFLYYLWMFSCPPCVFWAAVTSKFPPVWQSIKSILSY